MIRASALCTALLLFPACSSGGGSDESDAAGADTITYFRDIKPILDAKCGECHQTGGIAPFALSNFSEAVAHAGVSRTAINEGDMPPWLANDDCNDYQGNRSLSEVEKALFNRWVDEGMAEGNPEDEGEPIELDAPSLSRIDLSLQMDVDYTPNAAPDDYRCFVVDWPEEFTTDKFVTGFSATPGNLKIVHHVIAFLASPEQRDEYLALDAGEEGPGYTCYGGPRGSAQAWLGSWVPGTEGSDFPEGTGVRIEPGSTIVLQMHYNLQPNNSESDRTALDFRLADEVDKEAHIQPWANPQWLEGGMPIAAGDDDANHSFQFSPVTALQLTGQTQADSIQVYAAGLHMHTRGKSARLDVQRAAGGSDCLLQIDDWDFDWQGDYELTESMTLGANDQLKLECHWDNSAANQPSQDGQQVPPQDLNWGEGTFDEMCLGAFYWTE